MKIRTKRIRVIEMTEEEMQKFYECLEQAREGHTVHYGEQKLDDGSFLGVAMVTKEQVREAEIAEQKLRDERERMRGY